MKFSEKIVLAPAKINLFLAVRGKRPDGYHELASIMQKLVLADTVTVGVRRGDGISLSCPGSDLPEDETNLAWRAAALFLREVGLDFQVRIILEKNIPVSAGLGGGSSDAAAVLIALDELLGTNLSEEGFLDIAVRLGADVPFFVRKNIVAALAEGIGELLTPVSGIDGCQIVLVKPAFAVSTKWAFNNFALTTNSNPYILAPEKGCLSGRYCGFDLDFPQNAAPEIFFNDLESVTAVKYPVISEIKSTMLLDGAIASLMSGSGPTVFGIFTDKLKAVACYEKFSGLYENVFMTVPGLPESHSIA